MTSVQTLNHQTKNFATTAARNLLNIEKDIEKRIKSDVFQRGIRIKDFFYDFDKLRKGFVTEDKFKSALSMFNIYMSKDEVEELVKRYSIGNGLVKYDDFIKNIDSQFLDYDYARDNMNQTRSKAIFTQEEANLLNKALGYIKYMVKTKRMLIKIPFQDFDKTNTGHVTKEQFTRVLTTLNINLDEKTYDVLARKYMDKGNLKDVNYVKFWQDVDNLSEINYTVDPKKNEFTTYVPEDVVTDTSKIDFAGSLYLTKRLAPTKELSQVEKKIQAEVVMKKLRIKEFFKDFDGLRKGTVTETQFRRILDMTGIQLSDDEYGSLLTKYKQNDGLVNYRDFIENIDKVFTTKGIEKDPLVKVDGVTENTTLAARRKFFDMTEDEYNRLLELISMYRSLIHNRRILLKPHFEDFDKTNVGHISKNQFLRLLTQFGLLPEKSDLNLILKRYTDKGNLDEVNYYDFCKDIDRYEEDAKQIAQDHADAFKIPKDKEKGFRATIKSDNPSDVNDLFAKIRRICKEKRLRISEFLRDFDKLRSGGITNIQLRLGFDMAGIQLSDQEFTLLIVNFKHETKEGYVRWREICDAIEEVFTTKNLERTPWGEVTEPTLTLNYGKKPLTQEEVAIAQKVIRRFTSFARGTRLDIKQFFKDWDRLNRNKVSAKQFRQVLATIGFLLSDTEHNAVSRYYQCDEDNEVKYVEFINDTNIYKDIQTTTNVSHHNNQTMSAPVENHYQSIYLGLGTSTYGSPIDINILMGKIKNHIKVNQLRVEDYFKDFDPLRKGIITSNKFRGVLSKMKVDLTEDELLTLEERYKVETGELPYKINYFNFIEEINLVFTQKGLEKDPLIKPEPYEPPVELKQTLTQEEEEELHEYMLQLGKAVYVQRILIKPYFQDKDKTKSGKVSFPRFRAVLDVFKLPISDRFYELLCRRFNHQGKEFNYVEFIDVLRKYSEKE